MINKIHKICAEALKYPELKNDDDFFDVGGHSLIMAEIQQRLNAEHHIVVNMETLFRHTNVLSLASVIQSPSIKQVS